MSLVRQEETTLSHDRIVAEKTRLSYESFAQEYALSIPRQVTGGMKEWLDRFVAGVPLTGAIFEVGSGTGRDATYLESMGYRVQRSEIAAPFLRSFQEQGIGALRFDVLTDDFPGRQQAVFANSVFCHMTNRQLRTALENVHEALDHGGRLGFNTKAAPVPWNSMVQNERLPGERYFSRWPPGKLRAEVERAGFTVLWCSERPAILRPTPWVNLVVRKR
ncbi:class I SAM-dependent methyltransferase [Myceligenerans indicum]|uniref:Class I SAM-dependent methyltransferase n=1 Tax=Myceligenerans indicum TaxID=2593663 RepID=A0ABS1LGS0_9MICO|nr:class I SAM-dependent methyltransferase [Myceligenerans indicum]MBL0885018.1 class I SAM-dependent methyltransferase [Myceligenerans indicum]